MEPKSFFARLAVLAASTSALLALLHFVAPPAQAHWKLSVAAVLLFVLICTGLFFAGASAARSSNKHAFTNLVSVSVFGKMVVAIAFLFVYQQVAKPQNEWFVGIFLLCYVIFTVFEVWFMTRLAQVR